MLPQGETPLPLGKAAPAPIEPTKDELKALIRKLGTDVSPGDNVLANIVAAAVFDSDDPVAELVKVARTLAQVMRRPPAHALQILTPPLKRTGSREIFGQVRRALEAEASHR